MHSIADDPNVWQFYTWEELARSPSRTDGLTERDEQRCRSSCVNLLVDVGRRLCWHMNIAYLGIQLCHRYFAVRSYKQNDRYAISLACIYMAGKLRDAPKALSVVVQAGEHYRHRAIAADPNNTHRPWEDAAHLQAVREEVLDAERAVLYTLGFDLNLVPPFRYLVFWHNQKVVSDHVFNTAWVFINDSCYTQLGLVYSPQEIAAMAIYAGAAVSRMPAVAAPAAEGGSTSFCTVFNITADRLQGMLDKLMEVYVVHAAVQTGQQPAEALAAAAAVAAGVPPPLKAEPGQTPQVLVSLQQPAPGGTLPLSTADVKQEAPPRSAVKAEDGGVGVKPELAEDTAAPSSTPLREDRSTPRPQQPVHDTSQADPGAHAAAAAAHSAVKTEK